MIGCRNYLIVWLLKWVFMSRKWKDRFIIMMFSELLQEQNLKYLLFYCNRINQILVFLTKLRIKIPQSEILGILIERTLALSKKLSRTSLPHNSCQRSHWVQCSCSCDRSKELRVNNLEKRYFVSSSDSVHGSKI